jgi:iron complex outermembrane receptor protein
LLLGTENLKSVTRLFHEISENNFSFYNYGIVPHRTDTLKNADYRKSGILQEFYYRRYSDRFLALRFWYQKNDRNLPQFMSYEGSDREEFQHDDQFRIQYEWKKYDNDINYHFNSGLNSNELHYFRSTPEFNFVNENSKSRETSFQNQFRVFRQFDQNTYATLSVAANYYKVNINDLKNDNGYTADRLETSLMANFHLKPTDRFAAFILLRSENYGKEFVPIIPSVGLEWQFIEKLPLVFQMNAARNYHKPTLNDLYWLPGGNENLLAEDGFTGDISFSGNFGNEQFFFKNEISGFASLVKNWILWQPALNGAYYWEANNVQDVFSRGVEYHYSMGINWQDVKFKSGGNYSFTKTTNQNATISFDESRGKQLIYIPKHKGNWYASVNKMGFSLKYDIFFVGKRYTKSSNQESEFERILNPYWINKFTIDKSLLIRNLAFKIKFEIENLLNQDYQSILWRAMPGRYYILAIEFNFK